MHGVEVVSGAAPVADERAAVQIGFAAVAVADEHGYVSGFDGEDSAASCAEAAERERHNITDARHGSSGS